MTEWWTGPQAGLIGGGLIGILGAVIGSVGGILGPRGKGKSLVFSLYAIGLTAGVAMLIAGIAALALHQPYHVYFPLLQLGLIATCVLAFTLPVMRKTYRAAEQRRFEAEQLRRA
jgi:hypothetical protein